jgi:hypothetical protein
MWKFLCESVEGTSHRRSGLICQDTSFVTPFQSQADEGLILVCADGAGSASASKDGSQLACSTAIEQATEFLQSGRTVKEVDAKTMRGWMARVHTILDEKAKRLALPRRELACTLLVAVVGRGASAFGQIGDGAIIINESGTYRHVFWPQSGEYHNTTFFITDEIFEERLLVEMLPFEVAEIALMSDGMQGLALDYAAKTVQQGFFGDLFQALRAVENHSDLVVPMREWMDSEGVNSRTDDDKTLILATRVTSSADAIV